jgi:glycosyltransferase involved in cell wall biosynthesis
MSLSGTLIIASGPHGFGGAVQAFCRSLESLSALGAEAVYVALEKPYPLRQKLDTKIQFVRAELIESEVIGYDTAPVRDKYVLAPSILAETMRRVVENRQFERLIVWGTYLFPFGQAALMTKQILDSRGVDARLWISPVGSDIWEFHERLAGISSILLNDSRVEQIITPSEQFIAEIRSYFSVARPMQAIYPMIENSRFRPPSPAEKGAAREAMNIPEGAFVISNHSNMRPRKRMEDVLEIVARVARQLSQPVVLLLIGPEVPRLIELAKAELAHVDVRWIGVVDDVETYLIPSDLELNCSSDDSFNLSLAEAMACAVPCVSTDIVGVGKEILAAKGGVLFPYIPPRDREGVYYEDAVEAILKIAQNPAFGQAMGESAAAHAAKVFSQEHLREQYLDLLEGVNAP